MKIIDHGEWEGYEPEVVPELFRGINAMFCRRVSDGKDWYVFSKEFTDLVSIKMTIMHDTVMATGFEAQKMFPIGCRLIEVFDAGHDHETFRQKRFIKGRFQDAMPMAIPKVSLLIALHRAGLLARWREYVAGCDVELQLYLTEAPIFRFDDRRMQRAFGELGFRDARSREIFDAAKQEMMDG